MKKINISIQDIVKIAMILALFLVLDWMNGMWNVDIFPGIKIQFTPLLLLMSSLIFGSIKTGISISIFVFIIAWISPSYFLKGVTWVKGPEKIFGEYMLDYVLPLLSISIIPGLYKYSKTKYFHFFTLSISLLIKLLSHFIAGVVFWGGYASSAFGPSWNGFVYSYSIVANLLGMAFVIPVCFVIAWPSVNLLEPLLSNPRGKKW